ncbi:hypothetical protein BC833DRAFT_410585 [Globomyces pollinis-pini]|nr:hypothetical protein BC833DRAFT_410585 [Globomyces pollinis-pini]
MIIVERPEMGVILFLICRFVLTIWIVLLVFDYTKPVKNDCDVCELGILTDDMWIRCVQSQCPIGFLDDVYTL